MKTGNIKVHFLGASGTVTGSKYLIDTGERKILVDCGMFQGVKKLRELNWDYLPVDVKDIDTVLLTHGHMDHTGYLPKLIKMGYKGAIRGTSPTLDIASIILKDSAKIQEEEAKKANEEGYTKHSPAVPLYTVDDAERAIEHFHSIIEGKWEDLFEGIKVRFQYNGHILGAVFIELDIYGKRFVFSGDIGRKNDYLLEDPIKPQKADVLFIESTYGDRLHKKGDAKQILKEIIIETVERGGNIIIPSFAVERTQTLMMLLYELRDKGEIPFIPMIMDSPMASNVLKVFEDYQEWHKLDNDELDRVFKSFLIIESFKETWEVINKKSAKIIIAGSGMVSGGRVLTYLQQYLDKPENTILLTGFQAEGTRGRALLDGAHELKIYGKYYPVKAKVEDLEVLSAHADQSELIDWLSEIKEVPEKVFIIHGESSAADAFRVKLKSEKGWESIIPSLFDIVEV